MKAPKQDSQKAARAREALSLPALFEQLHLPEASRQDSLNNARIVDQLHLGEDAVQAAALHPAWKQGLVSREQGERELDPAVLALLQGMDQLYLMEEFSPDDGNEQTSEQAERFRRMLLAMVRDPRVIVLVLAQRLQQLRSARRLPVSQQRQLARSTLEVHAPLANRLGIWQLKWELEDLSLRYTEPEAYHRIARWLDESRQDREKYIEAVIAELNRQLDSQGIEARITGRPKHLYSIWKKIHRKKLSLNGIYDVSAVRLLVKDIPACYAALGAIHSRWRPIPGQFDDYIASPKDNFYQSLHTAVTGPRGRPLEVQIRTFEMHEQAEYGVAAHWRYKEGARSDDAFERRLLWLRRLVEGEADGDSGLLESFRAEIREERVYALTPRGHILAFPRGATVLDFAYAIHTDVGHRCRGARVNGRMVPLTHVLGNGDQVEILTGREPHPSRDWLVTQFGYVATGRARNKIRQWFRQQDHDKNQASGRELLERELHRLGIREAAYDKLSAEFGFERVADFLAAIGSGDITTGQISTRLARLHRLPGSQPRVPAGPARSRQRTSTSDAISIQGVGNLATNLARCCSPAPPDEIAGYITLNRGVSIHRSDCRNLLRLARQTPERVVEAQWGAGPAHRFPVDVYIEANDRAGLLRDITHLMSSEGLNVLAVNTRTDPDTRIARMDMTAEIRDLEQLSRVLNRLSRLPHVLEARRRTQNRK